MNEEEKILKFINEEYGNYDNYVRDLLDLYNKEKEKNDSISIQYEKVVDKLEALEQIEKEHKKENGELREQVKNSISILKIKEIIEELEKQEDWYIEHKSLDDLYGKIDILQELLEERN